jgi:hypothetical protein
MMPSPMLASVTLEMIDPVASSYAGDDFVLLGLAVWRNQNSHRPSDQLRGSISKQPLGGGITGLNDAVQVLRDDGIVRGSDDRSKVFRWVRHRLRAVDVTALLSHVSCAGKNRNVSYRENLLPTSQLIVTTSVASDRSESFVPE